MEALRLIAIAGIAVFHTFQPWFYQATGTGWLDVTWQVSPITLALLGCINLLGAWGNNVFFMISGYFLLPKAISAAGNKEYWSSQAKGIARRATSVLAAVLLYSLLSLGLGLFVQFEGLGTQGIKWLLTSLEFIWVYLVIIVITPAIAYAWNKPHRSKAIIFVYVTAVIGLSFYVAFFSQGGSERGLLEWRKLLSAATYLAAYLVGGLLAEHPKKPKETSRNLIGSIVASIALETAIAASNNLTLLAATSFKSTSALSFVLAVASVHHAVMTTQKAKTYRAINQLAKSVIGFYICQSLFNSIWEPYSEQLLSQALSMGGEALLIFVGIIFSAALLVAFMALDQLVRIPLFKRFHLA